MMRSDRDPEREAADGEDVSSFEGRRIVVGVCGGCPADSGLVTVIVPESTVPQRCRRALVAEEQGGRIPVSYTHLRAHETDS